MEQYFTNNVSLNENVAPKVTAAVLTETGKVTLTFSEAISDAAAFDFEVLVGGKSQATAEQVNLNASAAATSAPLVIAPVDADKLAKGITLKALDTLDIKDTAGNKLSVPANIVVTH